MAAKLRKVEIYNKGAPSIKSFDALSTGSSDHVTEKKTLYLYFRESYG